MCKIAFGPITFRYFGTKLGFTRIVDRVISVIAIDIIGYANIRLILQRLRITRARYVIKIYMYICKYNKQHHIYST